MTDSLAFEWFSFSFKDAAAALPGAAPPAAFVPLMKRIASQPQVERNTVYLGQNIETPLKWIVVIPWKSSAAYLEWQQNPGFKEFLSELDAFANCEGFFKTTLGPDAFKAIDAPCTEMLLCYGSGDGYLVNSQKFLKSMEQGELKGLHGTACGETLTEIPVPNEDSKAHSTAMVIGWDSRDAHLTAKAVPGNAIVTNLGLITQGSKSLDMWHVNFTKYTLM